MAEPMVIVGHNARPAAASAARAGYQPWSIDVAGRADTARHGQVRTCPPGRFPFGVLDIIDDWPDLPRGRDTPLLITGPLENEPELLSQLERRFQVWGSNSSAIAAARAPETLVALPPGRVLQPCEVKYRASVFMRIRRRIFSRWFSKEYLCKPLDSFGGRDIRRWEPGMAIADNEYLQEYIEGTPISAVFAADGWSCHLIAVTEQLLDGWESAGEPRSFAWRGSLGPITLKPRQQEALTKTGVILTQRHDLRGLFNIDAVIDRRGMIRPVEINPRFVTSIELIERSMGIAAMLSPPLKAPGEAPVRRPAPQQVEGVWGLVQVHADRPGVAVGVERSLGEGQVSDLPADDQRLEAGQLVCTVHARADTRDACLALLRQQRERALRMLQPS